MSVVVTGGAGFIGSCMVRLLNDSGIDDIIIVDDVADSIKWKNLLGKKFTEYINKGDFFNVIDKKDITAVVHLGACSSTTETNFDYLWENNVQYSKRLFCYCTDRKISFIYASSASTYGNGNNGFDDCAPIENLLPLNRYGLSKQLFDLWVQRQTQKPPQCVGLKFFNVYGPNEYHKNGMFSMVYSAYKQIEQSGKVQLFKSHDSNLPDGEQKRDFVYVKDVCKVVLWFMRHPPCSGLFNVGTGVAQSFNKLVSCVFGAVGREKQVEYIDMPTQLKKQYQSFTQASMQKLYDIGYTEKMFSLEEGICDYVKNYLEDEKYY